MALTKSEARQWPLGDIVRFSFDDLANGVAADAAALLPQETIVSGAVVVETAFTGGGATAATLNVGDSDDPDRYGAAVNVFVAGRTALTPTGFIYTVSRALQLTLTVTGGTGLTAGEGYVEFVVLREGRQTENV